MSQKKEKELAQKTSGEMMTAAEWGPSQSFSHNDIVIPKILPLQFMSEKVKNQEGKYGQFRDTLNNTLFGDTETPVEMIPFFVDKKWLEFNVTKNNAGARKREFKQILPIDHTNDGLPYVDEDGMVERDRCVDIYCLLPQHIEAGDSFPYVFSFRRTSLKAGNKIITQILRNERMGQPPCAVTMLVSGKTKQNDDGEFIVQDVVTGRVATAKEVEECFSWYRLVAGGKTKLDESDVATERAVEEDSSDEKTTGKF